MAFQLIKDFQMNPFAKSNRDQKHSNDASETGIYIFHVNFYNKWVFKFRSIPYETSMHCTYIWCSIPLVHTVICLGCIGSFFKMAFTKFAKQFYQFENTFSWTMPTSPARFPFVFLLSNTVNLKCDVYCKW